MERSREDLSCDAPARALADDDGRALFTVGCGVWGLLIREAPHTTRTEGVGGVGCERDAVTDPPQTAQNPPLVGCSAALAPTV